MRIHIRITYIFELSEWHINAASAVLIGRYAPINRYLSSDGIRCIRRSLTDSKGRSYNIDQMHVSIRLGVSW